MCVYRTPSSSRFIMVNLDRVVGNFLSPVSVKNENSFHYHQHRIKPVITVEEKHTFHQKADFHINSSKTQILSISGSDNSGLLLNDVHVNMTNIFDRPILLYFNELTVFHYLVPIIGALVIVIVLSLWLHDRQRQEHRLQTLKKHFNEHDSSTAVSETTTRKMVLLSRENVLKSTFFVSPCFAI